MLNFHDSPHRRHNPLTGDWVLVSPHRMMRPWQGQKEPHANIELKEYDPNCYLCPGNERAGGIKNPSYTGTFVFTNDFAALLENPIESIDKEIKNAELFLSKEVSGTCRVICFSPNHRLSLPEMETSDILEVVKTWIDETIELGKIYRWVQIFENKGEVMGCSNPHPHAQVWATNSLPTEAEKEQQRQKQFYKKHGESLLHVYAQSEIQSGVRVIEYNSSWLAVVPYWATWPYEMLLLPHRQIQRISDLNQKEQEELSEILKLILIRYDNIFETSFPYTMGWHGAPMGEESSYWQLHAHFYPPLLRSSNVKKFMVGYEMLSESQRDLTPEKAAERLREQSVLHYSKYL